MSYGRSCKDICCVFLATLLLGIVSVVCLTREARAQSSDQDAPTPVTDNVINGRISPRDIGDSRPTTHYFIFETQPGDLQVDVTSSDLDGDIDLFFARSLQPLAKVTLFATRTSTQVNRTLFMREASPLLLRVRARSSGDSTGTYAIQFGGSFLPSSRITDTSLQNPAPQKTEEDDGSRSGTQRVTSVGGRIEDTAEERNDAKLTPVLPASDVTNEGELSAPVAPPVRKLPRSNPTRSRRRSARIPRPPASNPTDDNGDSVEPRPSRENSAKSPRTRSASTPRRPSVSRLIIRTRDGGRVERLMSDVERVVIEGGELIVLLKSGEEQRLALTEVLRFAIEP